MQIVECPRDAMQGWGQFIATEKKIAYINQLLKVGYDIIDFGSFVSPKYIPQMRDTEQVLKELDLSDTNSKLLAIIPNEIGAEKAIQHNAIDYLGFPLSASETFQRRNTNVSIAEAFQQIEKIQLLCTEHNKQLLVYISMAFGNPYNEPWHVDTIADITKKLTQLNVKNIALADTIGVSNPQNISELLSMLIPQFPDVLFSAHLHTHPKDATAKIDAVVKSGCQRIDVAINGLGGCPMAKDDLVGNLATEALIDYLKQNGIPTKINQEELTKAIQMAQTTFY